MNLYTAICSFNLHNAESDEYKHVRNKLIGIGFDDQLMYEGAKRLVKMPSTTVVGEFYEDSEESLKAFLVDNITNSFNILEINADFFLMIALKCEWSAIELTYDD